MRVSGVVSVQAGLAAGQEDGFQSLVCICFHDLLVVRHGSQPLIDVGLQRLAKASFYPFPVWLSQALALSSMSDLKVLLCCMGRPGQRSKASTGVGQDATIRLACFSSGV